MFFKPNLNDFLFKHEQVDGIAQRQIPMSRCQLRTNETFLVRTWVLVRQTQQAPSDYLLASITEDGCRETKEADNGNRNLNTKVKRLCCLNDAEITVKIVVTLLEVDSHYLVIFIFTDIVPKYSVWKLFHLNIQKFTCCAYFGFLKSIITVVYLTM